MDLMTKWGCHTMAKMYASKIDKNQPDIVKEFRRLGASVTPTHNAGHGFPDLVVGFGGVNYLVEVKDPAQPPSKRKLTPHQVKWHGEWLGVAHIVHTNDDVRELLGIK